MTFVRATIENVSGAVATVDGQPGDHSTITVQFNPDTYEITKNQTYASKAVPGLQTPILQYVGGASQELSLTLLLDASDRSRTPSATRGQPPTMNDSVSDRLNRLRALITIADDLHAPPVIRFSWGDGDFTGVITEYKESFTLFNEEGKIQRARIALKLKQHVPPDQQTHVQNERSPDRTKTRAVRAGERLDMIAAQEYGDPAQWPVLARANGLARPRIVSAGTLLVIPPLT